MTHQSLYRRYRSRTFAEIKGQPHVTSALRKAVAEGRHGHAYLFSGPRGTGKTSTARVLAKALNCENLADGEPCCACKSCLDIENGRSFDLHELDAASNNKVDDIRDLIAKVSLGSPGRTKVYILDEVHMLTPGAENALLKTLEEPPDHVVFVLATTEPHKVVPTIRSRTQHFEFHLLPGDELADHVRWVAQDAGLDVDDTAISYALRQGGGSARDTLSALDLVVAAGGVPDSSDVGVELARAVGGADPGAAMVAVQRALDTGREPRTIGEETLDLLRDAFLASMGAPLTHLDDRGRAQAAELASLLGPATITRSLEELGQALVDMRQAPDPRVPLEVTILRLARRDGTDVAALLQRIEQLEAQIAELAGRAATADRATSEAPAAAPAADAPSEGRPTAGVEAEAGPGETTPTPPPSPRSPKPAGRGHDDRPDRPQAPDTPPAPSATEPAAPENGTIHLDQLTAAFDGGLLDDLEQRVRARFRLGHFVSVDGNTARFALPNSHVVPRCEEVKADVEAALRARFGQDLLIDLVVDDQVTGSPSRKGAPGPPSSDTKTDDVVDVTELEDAGSTELTGIDRLTQAFPGSTIIDAPQD